MPGFGQVPFSERGRQPGPSGADAGRGIARAFAYGGVKGQAIYDPAIKPTAHRTAEAYLKGGTTINHFYEKLLLLKARMNTATGRAMAEERHRRVMEEFLRRFYEEWEEDA